MGDPTTYVTAKIASAIGGLFGGMSMMSFIKPRTISEAFARGGISTGAAIIFATPLLTTLNLSSNWEMQLMAGGTVGFVAYSILGAVANFFSKNREDDIVDLANKVRGTTPNRPTKVRRGRRK